MSVPSTQTSEPEVLTEVPIHLKRLVKYIVRGFFEVEHALVIDMLVHHPCIKEDDLIELLRFERKQIRQIVSTLRSEKFIKTRMRVETDAEGKTTRHNYYFINYSVFVNVVKYKLDHMRRKIETEERDSTNRSSFLCPQCGKQFTDLEVGQLLDPFSGELHCTFCQAEVEEEKSNEDVIDARSLMAKFNDQIEPIYNLLREVEDIRLSQSILEPEPVDLSALTNPKEKKKNLQGGEGEWRTAQKDFQFGATQNTLTISLEEQEAQAANALPKKERPVWMTESTIEGANTESMSSAEVAAQTPASSADKTKTTNNDDIMKTLLAHEKKAAAPKIPGQPPASDNDSSTSESEDEAPKPTFSDPLFGASMGMMNNPGPSSSVVEEMESDEEEVAMVTIGSRQVPLHEVTEDMIEQMTAPEKEAYIALTQDLYQDMY